MLGWRKSYKQTNSLHGNVPFLRRLQTKVFYISRRVFACRLVANYRERSSKGLITRDVELGFGRSPSSRVVFIQKWLKLRPRTFSFLFSFRPKVEHFRLEPKTFIREHSYNLPRQTNEGRKESAPSGRPTFVRPWASPHSEWHCSVQNEKNSPW